VSALALTYRLHDIGMLSDWHYRTTCIELGQRGYRTDEPQGTIRETSQLLEKVFRLLRKKGVSRADIAAELCIGTDDINDFIFGLAMTAVDGIKEEKIRRGTPIQTSHATTSLQTRRQSLCPNCGEPHDADLRFSIGAGFRPWSSAFRVILVAACHAALALAHTSGWCVLVNARC
jgi:hypothetical protein